MPSSGFVVGLIEFHLCNAKSASLIVVCMVSRTFMGVIWGNGPVVSEGQQGLVIFSLEHYSALLPTILCGHHSQY